MSILFLLRLPNKQAPLLTKNLNDIGKSSSYRTQALVWKVNMMQGHFYLFSGNTSFLEKTKIAWTRKKKVENMDNTQNLIKSRTDSWSLFQEQKRIYKNSIILSATFLFIYFKFNRGKKKMTNTQLSELGSGNKYPKRDHKHPGITGCEEITAFFPCYGFKRCFRTWQQLISYPIF